MSGAGAAYATSVGAVGAAAQNGNVGTATPSASVAAMPSRSWRESPYVAPIGGGGASYYSQSPQTSQPPQHRAP